jgi:hypothetical protein
MIFYLKKTASVNGTENELDKSAIEARSFAFFCGEQKRN